MSPQSWIDKIETKKRTHRTYLIVSLLVSFLFGLFATYYLIANGVIVLQKMMLFNFDVTIPFFTLFILFIMFVILDNLGVIEKIKDNEELSYNLYKLAKHIEKNELSNINDHLRKINEIISNSLSRIENHTLIFGEQIKNLKNLQKIIFKLNFYKKISEFNIDLRPHDLIAISNAIHKENSISPSIGKMINSYLSRLKNITETKPQKMLLELILFLFNLYKKINLKLRLAIESIVLILFLYFLVIPLLLPSIDIAYKIIIPISLAALFIQIRR